MSARVMVVEDEAKIAALLRDYLVADGFDVRCCADGVSAVGQILGWPADVVVLDVRLPGRDGFDVCRALRAESAVPVLMLTARIEEADRIRGLDLGADDYVCKPFSPREVVARVRALLRRAHPAGAMASGLQLDAAAHEARWQGRALGLTPVEFRLLQALARRPGQVLSRQQLIEAAYDDHRVVSERTVDSHLKNLRRKLQVAGAAEDAIVALYGIGYRLGREIGAA
jgi:two-component system, OmpR family, response regulator BaeR